MVLLLLITGAPASAPDSADLLVIAPATANMIGKIANGVADDLLSTVTMAVDCPVLIAPAMNVKMIENRIVTDNIQRLSDLGYRFIEGESGRLACGYEGKGRMAEPDDIVSAISACSVSMLSSSFMTGMTMVTSIVSGIRQSFETGLGNICQ